MRGTMLVARRDLGAYFNSYWGYAVIAAVLIIEGLVFNAFALTDRPRYSAEVIEDFFLYTFGFTNVAAVLLTMRLIAEERQTGTMVLVDSTPVSAGQVVAGKYLSALTVMTLLLVLTLHMPGLVFVNGKVSYGHLAAGYLGLFLVGAAALSIGTFASTVARSQLVAGVIAAVIVVFFVTAWALAKVADPPLKDVFSYVSFFDRHFRGFMQGQIKTEDIVYYLSVSFVFLMLSSRYMAARRWR